MPPRPSTLSASVLGTAGLALAVGGGALLYAAVPFPLGSTVTLSLPVALPVVLLAAVVLVVAAAARERRAAAHRRDTLLTELWAANEQLSTQAAELARQRDGARLLESAVVHAHDAVVVLDAEPTPGAGRRVRYVNEAFGRMTGYSREEVVGRSLHLLRGPDTDPATLARIRDALDTRRPVHAELQNRRKDGTAYWVELSLVPAPGPDGRIEHWVMIQRDVSDRKRAEEELRASEERLRLLGDNIPGGVIYQSVTTPDGAARFGYISAGVRGVFGLEPDAVTADAGALYRLVHPDDADRLRAAQLASHQSLSLFDVEFRTYTADGELKWVHCRAMPRALPDGVTERYGVILDVTARRRLEEQLRESQKTQAIGHLAGGVAHDFNNLLTGVLGNLALVRLPHGDPNRPLLAAVEQAASRAADLTRKLLGYARKNQLLAGAVVPREAFNEVVAVLTRTADSRVRVVVEVARECAAVRADPGLLNQALLHLCLNGRDAMPDGGTLTLAAEPAAPRADRPGAAPHPPVEAGPLVRLSVTDTGVGMTEELRARIFEPFFTTKDVGKGTGLGLPMVRGIVEQHDGWVECTSALGAGTRIDLYLPAAVQIPDEREAVALSSPTPHPVPRPEPRVADAPTATPPPADPVVLLVDDEAMIRDLGRVVLERAGYRVLTADDGVAAVEVYARERGKIRLVVMDVTMPRMSGRDAYQHIVGLDPQARVLFSTGYSADDLAALDGAVGLLNKPYRPHDLVAAVRDALAATAADGTGA